MKTTLVLVGIFYAVAFIPAFRTAVAFYLMRNKDEVAHMAMRYGFLFGFLSIWIIYPFYIVKDCFSKG